MITNRIRNIAMGAACLAGGMWCMGAAVLAAGPEGWDEIPPAVRATFEAQRPGETPTELETETLGGQTLYEAEYRGGASKADITVDSKGGLVVVKTKITAKDLPVAVAKAIQAKYPDARIVEAESTTRGVFELDLRLNGKKTELVAKPDGTLNDLAEDDADADDEGDEEDLGPGESVAPAASTRD